MEEVTKEKLKSLDLEIKYNEPLSKHCTMRVGGSASVFAVIHSVEDLKMIIEALGDSKTKVMILGEGSNTIFVNNFDGLVIKNEIKGIKEVENQDGFKKFMVGAGENWHEFVKYCVDKNLSGNENLAFIPGTIGASPVQNIAAYGQVQEDTFIELEAIDLETGESRTFSGPECEFGYRTSVFKTKYKNKYCITKVIYQLKIAEEYIPETSYHSRYETLSGILEEIAEKPYTLEDIFNAVVEIRKRKLPQVEEVGTVGSFFVNPFITKEKLDELQNDFPNIQYYPVDKMQYPGLDSEILESAEIVKIPVGWLLEELGWKGKTDGNVGTSPKHALCIVVNGPATGQDVEAFAAKIIDDVFTKIGVKLQSEVNLI